MDIYPSLISSDLLNIKTTINTLDQHCNGYHLDIMDNHFVPNLTWGPMFINAIRNATKLPLHIHAMVTDPEAWLKTLKLNSSDTFIFHYESIDQNNHKKLVENIHQHHWKAGIAIKPSTSVEYLFDILAYTDMVLLMSVEPGFSGQTFIPETIKKIAPLIHMKQHNNFNFTIGMDGGINTTNIATLATQNINNVAVASAIFDHQNPVTSLKELYTCTMGTKAS